MRISLEEQIARTSARLKETQKHANFLSMIRAFGVSKGIEIEVDEAEISGFYLPTHQFYTKEYKCATNVNLSGITKEDGDYIYRLRFNFDFKPPKRGYPTVEIRCMEPGWEQNEKHVILKSICPTFDCEGHGSARYDTKHGLKEIIAFYKELGVNNKLLKNAEGIIKRIRKIIPYT